MDYHERKRAQVNVGHALQQRGWTLWGYHADESDSMTDYSSPASWLGIATHPDQPGVVVGIAVSDTQRSGWVQELEDYVEAGPCPKCNGTGIWPGGLSYAEAVARPERQHFAEFCAERDSQPVLPQAVSPGHYFDDGSPRCLVCSGRKFRYERVVTGQKQWPVFHPTPRGRTWHVECNGTTWQSGTGLQVAANYAGGQVAAERLVDDILAAVRLLAPVAQPAPAAALDLGGCQVMHERDWTWLKFDVKPSDTVRDALRQRLGASFSNRRMAWYIQQRVEADAVRAVVQAAHNVDSALEAQPHSGDRASGQAMGELSEDMLVVPAVEYAHHG